MVMATQLKYILIQASSQSVEYGTLPVVCFSVVLQGQEKQCLHLLNDTQLGSAFISPSASSSRLRLLWEGGWKVKVSLLKVASMLLSHPL